MKSRSDEEWKEELKAFEKSGKNLKEYCRGKGLNYHQMIYWRKKLGLRPGRSPGKESLPGFMRVEAKNLAGRCGTIVIRYPKGTELELPRDYELSNLLTLIKLPGC